MNYNFFIDVFTIKLISLLIFLLQPQMELPDDVLQLIREFSKPWFTYFREYNRALALMGRNSFPELKTCLLYHPEQILPLLDEFIQAQAESVAARHAYLPPDSKRVVLQNQMEYYGKRRNVHASHHKVVRESIQLANLKELECSLVECKLVVAIHAL